MKANETRQIFPALTGVRTLAAWLVFFHHYNPFSVERFGSFLNQFVQEFHVGVSIFFVLSGFLITHRYFNTAVKFNWRNYLVNRVARVYPMYFILTTFTFLLAADTSWKVYVLNITFLRGFFDDLKFTLISQGWSLTVEECFYLLAPIIFLSIRKARSVIFVWPVMLIALGCVLVVVLANQAIDGFFNSYSFMFIYTFLGRCFEFFCGVALALYFKPIHRKGWVLTGTGFLLMVALVMSLSMLGSLGASGIQTSLGIVVNNFALPVAIVLFFYGLLVEQTWLNKLLSAKLFTLLGKSSYTFYLIHVGVISLWLDTLVSGNLLLLFLMVNITALLLWWMLEEPLNKAILNLKGFNSVL
jgi:peptidoglycan/LPS O-acetylase OafA/YrhL